MIKVLTGCLHMDFSLDNFHSLASRGRIFSGTIGLSVILMAVGRVSSSEASGRWDEVFTIVNGKGGALSVVGGGWDWVEPE